MRFSCKLTHVLLLLALINCITARSTTKRTHQHNPLNLSTEIRPLTGQVVHSLSSVAFVLVCRAISPSAIQPVFDYACTCQSQLAQSAPGTQSSRLSSTFTSQESSTLQHYPNSLKLLSQVSSYSNLHPS